MHKVKYRYNRRCIHHKADLIRTRINARIHSLSAKRTRERMQKTAQTPAYRNRQHKLRHVINYFFKLVFLRIDCSQSKAFRSRTPLFIHDKRNDLIPFLFKPGKRL